MKHYRRRKFFYRFFLMKSPRNAIIFGYSLLLLFWTLLPTATFYIVSSLVLKPEPVNIVLNSVFGIAFLLWLFYAFGTQVYGYTGILRRSFRKGWWNEFIACISTLLPFAGAVTVSAGLFRQHRSFFAIAGVLGALLLLVGTICPFPAGLAVLSLLKWLGALLLLFAVAGFREKTPLRIRCYAPAILALLFAGGQYAYYTNLAGQVREERREISAILEHSIEESDFWQRQKEGFPLDKEPLASLIKYNPTTYPTPEPVYSMAEFREQVETFRQKNPEFHRALDEFLKLEVHPVGHPYTEETLFAMLMPELNTFRNAANYLCLELILHAGDRDAVLRYNAQLERLRDWSNGNLLIGRLVAIAIESRRLQALAYPLALGTLSAEDWAAVLKRKVDWGATIATAIGDEATAFQSFFDYLFRETENRFTPIESDFIPGEIMMFNRVIPVDIAIFFLRDYRFALGEFKDLILHLKNETKGKYPDTIGPEISRNHYILSGALLPALSQMVDRKIQMEDSYRLFETAVQVEEYRKKHGKLPESLDFLPEIPRDSIHDLPFGYVTGELMVGYNPDEVSRKGYRLYLRNPRIPDSDGSKARIKLFVPDLKEETAR